MFRHLELEEVPPEEFEDEPVRRLVFYSLLLVPLHLAVDVPRRETALVEPRRELRRVALTQKPVARLLVLAEAVVVPEVRPNAGQRGRLAPLEGKDTPVVRIGGSGHRDRLVVREERRRRRHVADGDPVTVDRGAVPGVVASVVLAVPAVASIDAVGYRWQRRRPERVTHARVPLDRLPERCVRVGGLGVGGRQVVDVVQRVPPEAPDRHVAVAEPRFYPGLDRRLLGRGPRMHRDFVGVDGTGQIGEDVLGSALPDDEIRVALAERRPEV